MKTSHLTAKEVAFLFLGGLSCVFLCVWDACSGVQNENKRDYWLSSCLLFLTGIRARETCPQCASVPVQWNERDSEAKWGAAKCEYLSPSVNVSHYVRVWNRVQKWSISTPAFHSVCHLERLYVAFHSFLFFSHTVYMLALLFSFCSLSLHLQLYFLFLLCRRSVSCVWNRRVFLEKYLTCRRRWSGRIKKLGYEPWSSSFVFY